MVDQVDVLIGNEEDFTAGLGFDVPGVDAKLTNLDVGGFAAMIEAVVTAFPRLAVVATTLRAVRSASRNDWGAVAWAHGQLHEATHRPDLEILDRVGGGDSFASGLVYGLLQGFPVDVAVEYGAAHGALAMTTPGDTSMATLAEVEHLVAGGGAPRSDRAADVTSSADHDAAAQRWLGQQSACCFTCAPAHQLWRLGPTVLPIPRVHRTVTVPVMLRWWIVQR